MLFGGMNLGSYCESVLYDIHIGKYAYHISSEDSSF